MRTGNARHGVLHLAKRCVVGFAMLLGVGGCDLLNDPERARLAVEVESLVYAPGGSVRVTLRNDERASWYAIPGCASGLQRREAGTWQPITFYCLAAHVTDSAVDQLSVSHVEVPAGGSAVLEYVLPIDAAPGSYRIGVTFYEGPSYEGRSESRNSATFEVRSFSLGARRE